MAFANGHSQVEGKFRAQLDLGYTVTNNGGGSILFSIEPKYNIKDNMNVGLRIGAAAIVCDINTDGESTSAKVSANGSYVGTYDYYFNKSGTSFVPYIEGGAGFYSIANVEFDNVQSSNDTVGLDASGKFGGLLRGGFIMNDNLYIRVFHFPLLLYFGIIGKNVIFFIILLHLLVRAGLSYFRFDLFMLRAAWRIKN